MSKLGPPKRSGWCETLGPPVKPRGAQTPWGVHVAKAAAAIRERARCGCTHSRTDGRSRSDASCVLPTAESQGFVAEEASRALAGRKLEAPSDAGHEPREGEKVRRHTQAIQRSCVSGLRVSARRFSRRRKASSGFAHRASTGTVTQGPSARRSISRHHPRGACRGSASVDEEVDRACLRVTARTSEVDTLW